MKVLRSSRVDYGEAIATYSTQNFLTPSFHCVTGIRTGKISKSKDIFLLNSSIL